MPNVGRPMHNTTRTALQHFTSNPGRIYDAHDIADATLMPYKDALTAVRNLARYGRISHIGGYLYVFATPEPPDTD